jgi:hypothetical protein
MGEKCRGVLQKAEGMRPERNRRKYSVDLDEGPGGKRGRADAAKTRGVSAATVCGASGQHAVEGLEVVLSGKKRGAAPVPPRVTGESGGKTAALRRGEAPEVYT